MNREAERKRLVELVDNFLKEELGTNLNEDILDKFADHLLDNGVIAPPVKVGDTVYYVGDTEIVECIVRGASFDFRGLDSIIVSQKHKFTKCTSIYSKGLENLNKIKFTKEEAQKALERSGEK
jgi:hypothetical protein